MSLAQQAEINELKQRVEALERKLSDVPAFLRDHPDLAFLRDHPRHTLALPEKRKSA